jgi:hypothetical protein
MSSTDETIADAGPVGTDGTTGNYICDQCGRRYATAGICAVGHPPNALQTAEQIEAAATTDAPASDAPATDVPATDAPATDAPTTDAPITDAPTTDAPATDAPAMDAPGVAAANAVLAGFASRLEELAAEARKAVANVLGQ